MFTESEPEFLKEEIRTQLESIKSDYSAGDTAQESVSGKTFTGIAGPFGVGKTTITNEINKFKPSIFPINTTTTRARKPGNEDPRGFKTADEGITFGLILEAVERRALVNYSVIKGGDIYATFPEDFPGRYNMGPLLPSSIEQIAKAGFKEAHFVYIVTPGELWRSFVEKSRRQMETKRFQLRVAEAIDSLSFARENLDLLTFVENKAGQEGIAAAAKEIRGITFMDKVASLPIEKAKQYLDEMYSEAEELALH